MQFSRELNQKIKNGDPLTDTELQVALDHFEALEAMLLRSGPEWGIARDAAIRETNRLRDFRDARKRDNRYRPAERGVFDINFRDGAYRVSISNYDGGKVVTLERHEAAVAEAGLQGRLSRAPAGSGDFTLELLENVKKQIQERWTGGYPLEVIDDIVTNVMDPAIKLAKLVPKAA